MQVWVGRRNRPWRERIVVPLRHRGSFLLCGTTPDIAVCRVRHLLRIVNARGRGEESDGVDSHRFYWAEHRANRPVPSMEGVDREIP